MHKPLRRRAASVLALLLVAGLFSGSPGPAGADLDANLIDNSSFEERAEPLGDGPAGWERSGPGLLDWRHSRFRSGSRSVSVRFASGSGAWWRTISAVPVKESQAYALRAWTEVEGTAPSTGAQARMRWLGAEGQLLREDSSRIQIDDSNWTPLEIRTVAPPGATGAQIMLGVPAEVFTGGSALFDDIGLWEGTPPTDLGLATPTPVSSPAEAQPPVSGHPATLEEARTRFRDNPAWQYRPFFYATFENTQDEGIRRFLAEMRSREIFSAVLYPASLGVNADTYLSQSYFQRLDTILGFVRDAGMHAILHDEYDYPSGQARGQVVANDPICRLWQLREDGSSYRSEQASVRPPASGTEYPDILNPDCMDHLLDITHRAHAQHLGRHLPQGGSDTVVGMYTDEPAFYNEARTIPWTPDLAQRFMERNGYDIMPAVRSVFRDDRPDSVRVRLDYWKTVADLLEESLTSPVAQWGEQEQVATLGHLFEDEHPNRKNIVSADAARWLQTMTAPGVDIVSREDEFPWHLRQASSAASEAGRSWAYTEGHNLLLAGVRPVDLKAMVDRSLARGNNMYSLYYCCAEWSPQIDVRWQPWVDRLPAWSRYFGRISQAISGGRPGTQVAVLDPWSAVLGNTPISESWERSDRVVEAVKDVSKQLDVGNLNWSYITEDALPSRVDEDTIRGGLGEDMRTLILPHADILPIQVARSVRDLADGGGTVIAYGALPNRAAEGPAYDEELRSIISSVFGSGSESRGIFVPPDRLPQLAHTVASRVNRSAFPLDGNIDGRLTAYTRAYPDGALHVITNDLEPAPHPTTRPGEPPSFALVPGSVATDGADRSGEWSFAGEGIPEIWDPETGSVRRAPVYRIEDGRTIVPLTLPRAGSAVVSIITDEDDAQPHVTASDLDIRQVQLMGGKILIDGYATSSGTYTVSAQFGDRSYHAEVEVTDVPPGVDLSAGWTLCFDPGTVERQVALDPAPVRCQPRRTGSWTLPDLSGAAPAPLRQSGTYSRTIGPVPSGEGLSWFLDLGRVAETARLSINGDVVGDRNWDPYSFDVTGLIEVGADVDILVQATQMPGQDAGILGPARLVGARHVRIEIPVGSAAQSRPSVPRE